MYDYTDENLYITVCRLSLNLPPEGFCKPRLLFERVIEASATSLCDVIRTKRKNFSLVENCMLFKTIRSAFILTLVVLLKKSRILYPKRMVYSIQKL